MNEGAKTGIFWGVALTLALLAFIVARPANEQDVNAKVKAGEALFKDFEDATKAAKLKIVKFNEQQGELSQFVVAKNRETGDWTIPSANNYPADAADQIRKAATLFLSNNISILDFIPATPEQHTEFGVREPNEEKLEVGDAGVGTLIEMEDESGNDLVSLIIGKEAKTEGQRYVRRPNQDMVYVVKLDVGSLSTSFTDWIEKDLLKLNPIDIKDVTLNDYAIVRSLQGAALQRNFAAEIEAVDGNKWELKKLTTYANSAKGTETSEIPEGKELDVTKLNEMKKALDDLKIVSVRRKPKGLSADLKFEANDEAVISSLQTRGFYLDKNNELYSANGEVIVGLKNGVEYLLRFGEIASATDESSENSTKAEGEEKKTEDKGGVNRYLLVTAKFDEASIPQPELAEAPQSVAELEKLEAAKEAPPEEAMPKDKPEGDKPEGDKPEGDKPEGDKPEGDKPEGDKPEGDKPEGDKPEGDKPEGDKPDGDKPDGDKPADPSESAETVSGTTSGGGAEAQDDAAQKPESQEPSEKPAAEPTADESKAAQAKVESKPEEKSKPKFSELSEDEKKERLEAEQERVKRENQRKLDERKEKVDQAMRSVRELNGRFGDWYYVVPESTYKMLRINQDQLFRAIQPTTPGPAPGGPGAPPGLPPGFNFQPQQ